MRVSYHASSALAMRHIVAPRSSSWWHQGHRRVFGFSPFHLLQPCSASRSRPRGRCPAGSVSPYGTYDQNGSQWEWCGTIVGGNRVMRGGLRWSPLESLQSTHRADCFPETGGASLGFRVSGVWQNGPVAQRISFAALPDMIWSPSGNAFDVSATSSSGGTVSFRITEGPVTLAGNTVTATQASSTGSLKLDGAPCFLSWSASPALANSAAASPTTNRPTNPPTKACSCKKARTPAATAGSSARR